MYLFHNYNVKMAIKMRVSRLLLHIMRVICSNIVQLFVLGDFMLLF